MRRTISERTVMIFVFSLSRVHWGWLARAFRVSAEGLGIWERMPSKGMPLSSRPPSLSAKLESGLPEREREEAGEAVEEAVVEAVEKTVEGPDGAGTVAELESGREAVEDPEGAGVRNPPFGSSSQILVDSEAPKRWEVKILRGSGAVAESWDLGSYIGNAVVDSRKKSMCIDDPSSGVNVHRLEDNGQSKVKSFPIPVKKKMRPRGVCYVNQCSEIVSGSDHGVIYVFDRRSGEIVDELRIDPEEWVQTVAGTDYNGVPTILAAKSRDVDAPNVIYVWRKKNKTRLVGTVALSESWRIVEVGMVVLVIIAMFWQNIASMSSQWIFGQV
ncbi:hypothetical protein DFH06DRAFT_1351722 [Mycena polygramma]|nr:hypothetical protein DFH06DRAFT_1351722 [Mycena polygramma]